MPDEVGGHIPPEPSAFDKGIAAARVALAAIPVVGGPAVELLGAVITPPLERRRDEWMRDVAGALTRFEFVAQRINNLGADEAFVSAFLQASHVALRTHQREKRDALRNAVLNAALPAAPDETLQQLFIALVDTMTVWHLRLLRLLQDPARVAAAHAHLHGARSNGQMGAVIEHEIPELHGQRQVYVQLLKDLYQRGLLDELLDVVYGGMRDAQVLYPADAFKVKRTTYLGDQFLAYVSEPTDS